MKKYPQNLKFLFIDSTKSNFIGLPIYLIEHLMEKVNSSSRRGLQINFGKATNELKFEYNENGRRDFLNSSLFSLANSSSNIRLSGLKGYISSGSTVEISADYIDKIVEDHSEINVVFNHHSMDSDWEDIKSFIDNSNLNELILSLFDQNNERDRGILLKLFGFGEFQRMRVKDISDKYNLSPQRIHQIRNSFINAKRFSIHGSAKKFKHNSSKPTWREIYKYYVESKISSPKTPDSAIAEWLIQFGDVVTGARISFSVCIDYLSLKFPNEYSVLRVLAPYIQSTHQICDFLYKIDGPLRRPDLNQVFNPILSDKSKLSLFAGVEISKLALDERTINVLMASGVYYADTLANMSIKQFAEMPNLGSKSISLIFDIFQSAEP